MTGQSEPTRMGVTLTVKHEQVRFAVQLLKGGEQGGRLPEREQARDVRKPNGSAGDALFYNFSMLHIPNNNTSDTFLPVA